MPEKRAAESKFCSWCGAELEVVWDIDREAEKVRVLGRICTKCGRITI